MRHQGGQPTTISKASDASVKAEHREQAVRQATERARLMALRLRTTYSFAEEVGR